MVALGLVLLVLSGALALGVVLSNTDPVTASAFGVTVSDVTIGGFFLVGAVTGLVFMLGLAMMLAGASRRRTRRKETRRTVKDVRTEKDQLEQENAELRERLTAEPYPGEASRNGTSDVPGKHSRRGVFGRS
jgi:Mg2+/citrate symporter